MAAGVANGNLSEAVASSSKGIGCSVPFYRCIGSRNPTVGGETANHPDQHGNYSPALYTNPSQRLEKRNQTRSLFRREFEPELVALDRTRLCSRRPEAARHIIVLQTCRIKHFLETGERAIV